MLQVQTKLGSLSQTTYIIETELKPLRQTNFHHFAHFTMSNTSLTFDWNSQFTMHKPIQTQTQHRAHCIMHDSLNEDTKTMSNEHFAIKNTSK